jgi:hypothetical protein
MVVMMMMMIQKTNRCDSKFNLLRKNVTASVTLCMHEVFQRSPCLLETETQTDSLWVPQQRSGIHQELWYNLWRSGFRHYLCAHLTFGDQLRSDRHDTVDHCLRLKLEPPCHRGLVSLPAAFIEVWPVFILIALKWRTGIYVSGGLVINHSPQIFTTFIVKAASITFTVVFDVTLSAADWYILHKFTGDL